MRGRTNSSCGLLSGPRSRPTTVKPAIVSSLASIAPVSPTPMTTQSTSFSFVTMALSSREVGDRLGLGDVALVAILVDLVGVGRGQAGIAEHAPRCLVAIAAVDGIGEEPLHGNLQQALEEESGVEAVELGLASLHRGQGFRALLRGKQIERLAVGLARPLVRGPHTGNEELVRREWQLIALLRSSFQERAGAVHLGAAAPGACKLPVDEGDAAALRARWRQLIGGDHRVDGRREESLFFGCDHEARLGSG